MAEEVLKAIQDVLKANNQEVYLAEIIQEYALAPDETPQRIRQLLEEELDIKHLNVKSVELQDDLFYRVACTDWSEYHVFEEHQEEEVIRWNVDEMEPEILSECMANFVKDRITNTHIYWGLPDRGLADRMRNCVDHFIDIIFSLDEHYDDVDWMHDSIYEKWYRVAKKH
jgi:hypothetical protein